MNVMSTALVLLTFAKETISSGCPLVVPLGDWAQGAAHQAVSAGSLKFSVAPPIKSQGFNRTAEVEGLCSESYSVSTSFTCKSFGGEFSAGAPEKSPVALKLGGASCPLTGISAYKTPHGQFEAELRLQFDKCVGAPVKTSAAVVVGIVSDPVKDSNLVAWSQDVCKVAVAAPLSKATVVVNSQAQMQKVVADLCTATDRKTIANIASVEQCKLQCLGSETKAAILGGNHSGCSGFAFNGVTKSCKTYSGLISEAKTVKKTDWVCYTMVHKLGGYSKVTTPAPVAINETELLNIHEVFDTFTTAFMQQISPPADCANELGSQLWWFTLQDVAGNAKTVPVKAGTNDDNWKAFMDKLPTATPTTSKIMAPQVVDRVVFTNSCVPQIAAKEAVGLEAESCYVPPSTSHCEKKEVTNIIIASVVTCIVTCALVAIAFFLYWKAKGRKNIGQGYSALDETGAGSHLCNANVSCGLSVIAIGCAAIACYVSLTFISSIPPGSKGCYNEKEFLLPILATGISVALTIIIFLYYVGSSHKAHPHPLLVQPSKAKEEGKTTLMLVEVEDGQNQGVQLGSVTASSQGKLYTSFTTSANQYDQSPFQSQQSTNGGTIMR